jgi:6-phosphogluconolactonase
MPSHRELQVLETSAELFQAAAAEFASQAAATARTGGRFCVALSGGSTPRSLYALLASGSFPSIPWDNIYFFFGDERHVPPGHLESNYRMANEAMLSKVPVPPANVFRIHAEQDAEAAAIQYEQTLRQFFKLQANEFPRFDLVLLGLGPDGHIASLFPGSTALGETKRLVVANWVEKFNSYRITLTFPVLDRATCVVFLVSGSDKASILHKVFEDEHADLPAQRVRPVEGRLLWLADRAAAASLSR